MDSVSESRRWILLRLGFCHDKNLRGWELLCREACAIPIITESVMHAKETPCDLLWIPMGFVPPDVFPRATRIVYGPHNFVFPNYPWTAIRNWPKNTAYNCLSDWNRRIAAAIAPALPLCTLPFPVDVNAFCPAAAIEPASATGPAAATGPAPTFDCFVYVKKRRPGDIERLLEILERNQIRFRLIKYGSYKEEDYKAILRSVRYGIWVGCHESQGFALEEALSSNVPLLVWDVERMGDEWEERRGAPAYTAKVEADWPATTAPYWDKRCGFLLGKGDSEELESAVRVMQAIYMTFSPRAFVLEMLSPSACLKMWNGAAQ